jgi:uncharacterized membrane protein
MTEAGLMSALAIALMALATVLTRLGGFWMMAHVPLTRRVRRMLEALPGSVIAATVLPVAVHAGSAAMIAIAAAVGVMIVARNELVAMAVGVAVAALARAAGL